MPSSGTRADGISSRLVLLVAVACGAAVANLYYGQPLLHTLAPAFARAASETGLQPAPEGGE